MKSKLIPSNNIGTLAEDHAASPVLVKIEPARALNTLRALLKEAREKRKAPAGKPAIFC
jgi:hypothetical protein